MQHGIIKQNYMQAWRTLNKEYNDPNTLDVWRNMPH